MADLTTHLGCLASCTEVNQEEVEAWQREMKACQDKIDAAIHSIQSESEETIKHQVEDVLAWVDQRTQDLQKELNKKIYELQVDLQVVKMLLDTWKKSL
jgi:hypothetical protein